MIISGNQNWEESQDIQQEIIKAFKNYLSSSMWWLTSYWWCLKFNVNPLDAFSSQQAVSQMSYARVRDKQYESGCYLVMPGEEEKWRSVWLMADLKSNRGRKAVVVFTGRAQHWDAQSLKPLWESTWDTGNTSECFLLLFKPVKCIHWFSFGQFIMSNNNAIVCKANSHSILK